MEAGAAGLALPGLEVIPMRETGTESTVRELRALFARFGIPGQLVSDNGPQFTSAQFAEFLASNGVRHVPSRAVPPQQQWSRGTGRADSQERAEGGAEGRRLTLTSAAEVSVGLPRGAARHHEPVTSGDDAGTERTDTAGSAAAGPSGKEPGAAAATVVSGQWSVQDVQHR